MGNLIIPKSLPVEFFPFGSKRYNGTQYAHVQKQCYTQRFLCADRLKLQLRSDALDETVKLNVIKNGLDTGKQAFTKTIISSIVTKTNFTGGFDGWLQAPVNFGAVPPFTNYDQTWTYAANKVSVPTTNTAGTVAVAHNGRILYKEVPIYKGKVRIKVQFQTAYSSGSLTNLRRYGIIACLFNDFTGIGQRCPVFETKLVPGAAAINIDQVITANADYAYIGFLVFQEAIATGENSIITLDNIEVSKYMAVYGIDSVLPNGTFDFTFDETFENTSLCNSDVALRIEGNVLPYLEDASWESYGPGAFWNRGQLGGSVGLTTYNGIPTSVYRTYARKNKVLLPAGDRDIKVTINLPENLGTNNTYTVRIVGYRENDTVAYDLILRNNIPGSANNITIVENGFNLPFAAYKIGVYVVVNTINVEGALVRMYDFSVNGYVAETETIRVDSEWESSTFEGSVLIRYKGKDSIISSLYYGADDAFFEIRLEGRFYDPSIVTEQRSLALSNNKVITLAQQSKNKKMLELGAMTPYMLDKVNRILQHASAGTLATVDEMTGENIEWSIEDGIEIIKPGNEAALREMAVLLTEKNLFLTSTI